MNSINIFNSNGNNRIIVNGRDVNSFSNSFSHLIEIQERQTFALPIQKVVVQTSSHNVFLESEPRSDGMVSFEAKGSSDQPQETWLRYFQVFFERGILHVSFLPRNLSFQGSSFIRIVLPEKIEVEYEGDTESGDLNLHTLQGQFRLNTMSGDIRGKNLVVAHSRFKTMSGDVRFKEFSATAPVQFESMSGDIKVALKNQDEPYHVNTKTMSGKTKIHIPTVPHGITLQASSMSGDIKFE